MIIDILYSENIFQYELSKLNNSFPLVRITIGSIDKICLKFLHKSGKSLYNRGSPPSKDISFIFKPNSCIFLISEIILSLLLF